MVSTQLELQKAGLAEAIRVVRRRILLSQWLCEWVTWLNWTLAALLIALAVDRRVRLPLLLAMGAAVAGAIALAIRAWYLRPGSYVVAQRLDSVSQLGDRISTAVHFWEAPHASSIILRQREDALVHLSRLDAGALFPMQSPSRTRQMGALLIAVAALYAYHSVYGPPVPGLVQKALQSRALATVIAPFSRTVEFARAEEQHWATAAKNRESQSEIAEERKISPPPASVNPMGQAAANAGAAGVANTQALQSDSVSDVPPGDQTGTPPPGDSTGDPDSAGASAASDNQNSPGQSGAGSQGSMAQRALQAIKSLMQSAMGNQASNAASAPAPADAASSGAQGAPGEAKSGDAASQAAAQGQKANSESGGQQSGKSPGKHTGAGSGTHPWETQQAHDPSLAASTKTEHVELQSSGYRGPPGKERADVEPGSAKVPMMDVSPQPVQTVNGAGQDSIPARYRQYVQDYFQQNKK